VEGGAALMKIYVVMGWSGDHSEREEWAVCAYSQEPSARAHVEAATKRELEIDARYQQRYWKADERGKDTLDVKRGRNELDPSAPANREPARYFIHTVELDPVGLTRRIRELVQAERTEKSAAARGG
jgi:hypothetical protein